MPGGDLTIQASLHRSGLWITIPVTVARLPDLPFVLDSGPPVSAISPGTAAALDTLSLLAPAPNPGYRYRLAGLTVQGQPIPDLEVRVLPRLARLRIAGLLGLDFLRQFRAIHFYVDTRQLVLEARPPPDVSDPV